MRTTAAGLSALALLASIPLHAAPACQFAPADAAWLEQTVRGWDATRRLILQAPVPASLDAVIFDSACRLESATAMRGGKSRWISQSIPDGVVRVGAQDIPVGVVSATIGDGGGSRFVMSTPSLWAAARVPPGTAGLEKLMSAVAMHEATHVFQMASYGRKIEALQTEIGLSDEDFNDDAIQARFGSDPDFTASIQRETELLFSAANTADTKEARRLATEARVLMRARARRYYVGDQAYQARAEPLWLTLEGSGQWAGFRWLQLPTSQNGGGLTADEAMAAFGKRGKSWTQLLGLAMTLSVERLAPVGWKLQLFGEGGATLPDLLDKALQLG